MAGETSTAPAGGDINRGPSFLAILWATLAISIIFVFARVYVRLVVIKYHGWDDYWIIASIILGIIGTALDSVSVHHGLGHHSFYLDLAGIINATKYNMIAIPFNLLSSAFAKTSICFFLLHVNQSKKRARFLYGMVGTMLMFTLAASILVFAQCSPVYALWTPSLSATNCLPAHINSTFGLAQSIFMCIADITFALFPLTFLWKLKMNGRTKVALAFVLSLGGVAAGFGIVRCISLKELDSRADILFSTIDLAIWSFLEQNVTIMAACCPVLYKIFSTCLGTRGSQATGYSGKKTPWPTTFSGKSSRKNGSKQSAFAKKYAYGTGIGVTTIGLSDDDFGDAKNYIPLDDVQLKNAVQTWERRVSANGISIGEGDIEAKAGSEDGILHDVTGGDLTILKTTEISTRSERCESLAEAYKDGELAKKQTMLMFS